MPLTETMGVERDVVKLYAQIETLLNCTDINAPRRKACGVIYTPRALADLVVGKIISASKCPTIPANILDPACGRGHFLIAAWRAWRQTWKSGPPPVARLHGIEVDLEAANRTRDLLRQCSKIDALELGAPLAQPHIVVADALVAPLPQFAKRFDAVLGNPPYVRIDRLAAPYRAHLLERYGKLLTGKWDLYYCFFSRALDFLKPGGILGYITGNQFLLGDSARKLRHELAACTTIQEIADLCALEPFDSAIPATAITILRNEPPRRGAQVRITLCVPAAQGTPGGLAAVETGAVEQSQWQNRLWSVWAPNDFLRWLDRRDMPRLEDLALKITEGDTKRSEEILLKPFSQAPFGWWPVVRGRDIGPLTHPELSQADRLPPAPNCGAVRRILIRDIAPRLTATLAPGSVRCLRTVYCIYPKNTSLAWPMAGLLNTDVLAWIYLRLFYTSKMSPRAANFRFQRQFLAQLPMAVPPKLFTAPQTLAAFDTWAMEAYQIPIRERSTIFRNLQRMGALRRGEEN